jgi:hypothetical protein
MVIISALFYMRSAFDVTIAEALSQRKNLISAERLRDEVPDFGL